MGVGGVGALPTLDIERSECRGKNRKNLILKENGNIVLLCILNFFFCVFLYVWGGERLRCVPNLIDGLYIFFLFFICIRYVLFD